MEKLLHVFQIVTRGVITKHPLYCGFPGDKERGLIVTLDKGGLETTIEMER